jgi:hypothetical protein
MADIADGFSEGLRKMLHTIREGFVGHLRFHQHLPEALIEFGGGLGLESKVQILRVV